MMYKILKNWLSTEGSGLYFFFKRGLPFTFTSHCFIGVYEGVYKPLPGNAAIFPWAWGVGCSTTTVLLDLAYCQSPYLYRTICPRNLQLNYIENYFYKPFVLHTGWKHRMFKAFYESSVWTADGLVLRTVTRLNRSWAAWSSLYPPPVWLPWH